MVEKRVKEKPVEDVKDVEGVEGSSPTLPFVLDHLPPPDRQMSIYGLVEKEEGDES